MHVARPARMWVEIGLGVPWCESISCSISCMWVEIGLDVPWCESISCLTAVLLLQRPGSRRNSRMQRHSGELTAACRQLHASGSTECGALSLLSKGEEDAQA